MLKDKLVIPKKVKGTKDTVTNKKEHKEKMLSNARFHVYKLTNDDVYNERDLSYYEALSQFNMEDAIGTHKKAEFTLSIEYEDIEMKLLRFMRKEKISFIDDDNVLGTPYMCFDPQTKIGVIVFQPHYLDLEEIDSTERLIVLAHELGHYLDYTQCHGEVTGKDMRGFSDMDKDMEYEMTAWKIAELILKDMHFYDWDEFNSYKEDALLTYADMDYDLLQGYLIIEDNVVASHLSKLEL